MNEKDSEQIIKMVESLKNAFDEQGVDTLVQGVCCTIHSVHCAQKIRMPLEDFISSAMTYWETIQGST